MTQQPDEPTIPLSQVVAMVGALDLDKVRDADGQIDGTKLASVIAALTPGATPSAPRRRGPSASGHTPSNGTGAGRANFGREMYEERHRTRAKYDT